MHHRMADTRTPLHQTIFAKTALGQQEVQSRAMGLTPLVRRLLILVDGKRSGQELAAFVNGHAVSELLDELLQRQCIETVAASAVQATAAAAPAPAPAAEKTATERMREAALAGLPPPESRGAKDVEMARNFMTNTVNTIFQPNTRLTLLKAIFDCRSAAEVRAVYPRWSDAIASSAIGAKRLPEFHDKLFKVL